MKPSFQRDVGVAQINFASSAHIEFREFQFSNIFEIPGIRRENFRRAPSSGGGTGTPDFFRRPSLTPSAERIDTEAKLVAKLKIE